MRAGSLFKRDPARTFFVLSSLLLLTSVLQAATPYTDELIAQAKKEQIAANPYWHRLLHFRRNIFGLYRSDVDDPKFFLSPQGRKDPQAELEATIKAFFVPAPVPAPGSVDDRAGTNVSTEPEESAQCKLPARYAWLKEQLKFDPARLPEDACPRLNRWLGHMNAESVTLVFASYYMNNPSSMYGHSFLRLNGKGHGPAQRLLDYTVNYAATVDTNNGILFAVYGLTGGYRGQFATVPYYIKVQEYNNMESRDLWEYQLNLEPEAVKRMTLHLWELGHSSIAYYFLNKNCSYQLLPVLEVAEPKLSLSHSFWFKAIPVDTLRAILREPGLVQNVELRPSHVTKMLSERQFLEPREMRTVERQVWADESRMKELLQPFPVPRQALMLDSAYSLFRYKVGFVRVQPPKVQEQDHRLLSARNALGALPPTAMKPSTQAPQFGHKTGRIGLSYGFTNRSHFEELSLRAAAHDQDDPPEGYLPGSQLQMFHLRLRYDNDRKVLYPQQLTLVDLISFSPWDRWVRKPSWRVQTGLNTANDLNKDPEHALYYGLGGGSGFSLATPISPHSIIYALAEVDSGIGTTFRDNYRLGGGGSTGFFVEVTRHYRAHFNASYFNYLGDPDSATKLQLFQSVPLYKDMELRMKLERQNIYKEVLLSLYVYL